MCLIVLQASPLYPQPAWWQEYWQNLNHRHFVRNVTFSASLHIRHSVTSCHPLQVRLLCSIHFEGLSLHDVSIATCATSTWFCITAACSAKCSPAKQTSKMQSSNQFLGTLLFNFMDSLHVFSAFASTSEGQSEMFDFAGC